MRTIINKCAILVVIFALSPGRVGANAHQQNRPALESFSHLKAQAFALAPRGAFTANIFQLARNLSLSDRDLDTFIDPRVTGANRVLARRLMRYMPANLRGDFVFYDYHDNLMSNNPDLLPFVTIRLSVKSPIIMRRALQTHNGAFSKARSVAVRTFGPSGFHRLDVNPSCAPAASETGAYARNVSRCGFTTGWGFVNVPCGSSQFASGDAGTLYMELTGSGINTTYGKSASEGGLQYNSDSSIQPYQRNYGSQDGYYTLNNSSVKYTCGQNLAVMHGSTYDANYLYTNIGQVPSSLNPSSNWIDYGTFSLQNAAWLFSPSNGDVVGGGTDNYGVHTPCLTCSITQVTSIAQNNLPQGSGYRQDGSYFGVTQYGEQIHWMQVAFGEWDTDCEPGTNLCTFIFPPDPQTYLGGLQLYPDSFISETYPNSLGWGAYETYDGIDLSYGGIPASERRAAGAFSDPHPPYPCAIDAQNYCSVGGGTGTTSQCQLGTKPNGSPSYLYGTTTTYRIYGRSDVFRFLENASYTKTVSSNRDDPPTCNVSYQWTPAEPKQQYSDSNLP